MGDIWVDVSVSMILEGEASSSKASMRSSLEAGSKTVSRSDKEMEVFMTSKSTLRARGWITKSCHEPVKSALLQSKIQHDYLLSEPDSGSIIDGLCSAARRKLVATALSRASVIVIARPRYTLCTRP